MKDKIIIVPQKVAILKSDKIKHFFKTEHGFMIENLRFSIKLAKLNPEGMRLHIQIWLPLIHIVRDNSKWEIGNRYRLYLWN